MSENLMEENDDEELIAVEEDPDQVEQSEPEDDEDDEEYGPTLFSFDVASAWFIAQLKRIKLILK